MNCLFGSRSEDIIKRNFHILQHNYYIIANIVLLIIYFSLRTDRSDIFDITDGFKCYTGISLFDFRSLEPTFMTQQQFEVKGENHWHIQSSLQCKNYVDFLAKYANENRN